MLHTCSISGCRSVFPRRPAGEEGCSGQKSMSKYHAQWNIQVIVLQQWTFQNVHQATKWNQRKIMGTEKSLQFPQMSNYSPFTCRVGSGKDPATDPHSILFNLFLCLWGRLNLCMWTQLGTRCKTQEMDNDPKEVLLVFSAWREIINHLRLKQLCICVKYHYLTQKIIGFRECSFMGYLQD